MNKINFNQEYDQLNKKYREESKSSKSQEYSIEIAINDMLKTNLISSKRNILTLGAGKEAFVILAEKNGKPVCVKSFRPYSNTNVKRKNAQHHITEFGMSSIMARDEFQNLEILDHFGVNVPKPFEYNNGLSFSMKLLSDRELESFQAAPLLRNVHLKKMGFDPGDILEDILDQIELMWNRCKFVHGDLSEFNIIFSYEKPYIIDVSQSRLYNFKTFTTTPVRIRIDRALSVLERDLEKIMYHFQKKYRIYFNNEEIYQKLMKNLPEFAKKFSLLEQRNMVKKRVARTFFMEPEEVSSNSGLVPRAKQRRIHSKINLWEN
ncbi:MAG: RIO-type serine/threonine-protein kinase Rio1 [Candidatus Heimdallarchaeota archaeon LC_3]|nr:MAG: RIO-type serine/threonine-protein kinase Rio1 [Candidatus Heimdallarchaeota archaeon LC_3]